MGLAPEGALNLAAWQMIRDIVGSDPALTEAAWEDLQDITAMMPANRSAISEAPRRAVNGYLEF